MRFLPSSIQDIFGQLGLYDTSENIIDENLIFWWDQIASAIYSSAEAKRLQIGRFGEWLTYIYEELRTNFAPNWVAVDSNRAGYDLLSIKSKIDTTKLCIEVKTNTSSARTFHLSKGEWDTATTKLPEEYLIYYWDLENIQHTSLNIIEARVLAEFIPSDTDVCRWQDCIINFKKFPEDLVLSRLNKQELPKLVQDSLTDESLGKWISDGSYL